RVAGARSVIFSRFTRAVTAKKFCAVTILAHSGGKHASGFAPHDDRTGCVIGSAVARRPSARVGWPRRSGNDAAAARGGTAAARALRAARRTGTWSGVAEWTLQGSGIRFSHVLATGVAGSRVRARPEPAVPAVCD